MSKYHLSYTVLKDIGFRLLAEGKTIRVRAEGISMYPSIKSGSVIFIEPFRQGTVPVTGEIIAWKRDSGIVVHRLISIYRQKNQKYYITRGDSSLAEDEPVLFEQIAGKVVRVENPEGKPVPPEKYINKKPNYSINRFLVRIISQFYRVKRTFIPLRVYTPTPPGGGAIRTPPWGAGGEKDPGEQIFMKGKIALFRKALNLVWDSAPGWATVNIVISVLQSFLPLVLVWLIKLLIDEITQAVSTGSAASNIIPLIIAVVVVYFLDEVSTDSGNYVRNKQSVKLEGYMFGLLHSKAVRLDLINFEHPGYYDCLSRATSEAPWRPNSILNNIVSMFRGLLSLILMAGLLVTLHWGVALLLLVVNIPGIWLRLHYADILYNFQREQTPEARKSAYFSWLLTGDRPSREIRLFGLGNYFISLFKKSFNQQKEEELNIIRKRTLIELISDAVKASAILVLLLIIARQTIDGKLTLGQMAMFLLAFRQGMTYIKDLFSSIAGLYEDGLFIGDTFEFLDLKENVVAQPPVATPAYLKSEISVEKLSFTYPGNQHPSVDNISFAIKKGEIVALVGPNGAGKSTLVRLLTRLYDPDSGIVKWDGKDIRTMDPDEYRKFFSVVFQDFMLYNLSAGENIRMGNIEIKGHDRKIRDAASSAGVDDLLNNLPRGYDTVIGTLFDDSRELSWGEWQKIALARALFREAPVLILDEPSSSLDADTEYEIFSRFREIVNGRTSILITHRFTNVTLADRIIVLENGAITETGTHGELMNKKGRYYDMFTKQTNRF